MLDMVVMAMDGEVQCLSSKQDIASVALSKVL